MQDVKISENEFPPVVNKKYPFERLTKRGQVFFLPGANPHNMRQAARSFEQHHPDIGEAGDRLWVRKEKGPASDEPNAPQVDGAKTYRTQREE
jgi:hypothetical protein